MSVVYLHVSQQCHIMECCTTMLLRRIYVADNNRTYLGLHVKLSILLFHFNQIRIIWTDRHKSPDYQIS